MSRYTEIEKSAKEWAKANALDTEGLDKEHAEQTATQARVQFEEAQALVKDGIVVSEAEYEQRARVHYRADAALKAVGEGPKPSANLTSDGEPSISPSGPAPKKPTAKAASK